LVLRSGSTKISMGWGSRVHIILTPVFRRYCIGSAPRPGCRPFDKAHGRELVKTDQVRLGGVFATEAILTEVLHLVNFSIHAQTAAIEHVLQGMAILVPASLPSLKGAQGLVEKYHDIPKDYADASLIFLDEDLPTDHIVTFDRRDLGIFRLDSGRPFQILP
jgi:uncharacterized protein